MALTVLGLYIPTKCRNFEINILHYLHKCSVLCHNAEPLHSSLHRFWHDVLSAQVYWNSTLLYAQCHRMCPRNHLKIPNMRIKAVKENHQVSLYLGCPSVLLVSFMELEGSFRASCMPRKPLNSELRFNFIW